MKNRPEIPEWHRRLFGGDDHFPDGWEKINVRAAQRVIKPFRIVVSVYATYIDWFVEAEPFYQGHHIAKGEAFDMISAVLAAEEALWNICENVVDKIAEIGLAQPVQT